MIKKFVDISLNKKPTSLLLWTNVFSSITILKRQRKRNSVRVKDERVNVHDLQFTRTCRIKRIGKIWWRDLIIKDNRYYKTAYKDCNNLLIQQSLYLGLNKNRKVICYTGDTTRPIIYLSHQHIFSITQEF